LVLAVQACAGADFEVKQSDLTKPVVLVTYGDTRFTDPANTDASNPAVRKWLVDRIARERPAAILISGDLPWHGAEKNDYAVFARETRPWREEHLRVYPALGNHELNGPDPNECLNNWHEAFPELQRKRWYSVALGKSIYLLNLDSNSSLLPGSEQDDWIHHELQQLPKSVGFVFVTLHHPPVSDFQPQGDASHNVRPNEAALANLLREFASTSRVKVIVNAGHVHNYERFRRAGITYLVSGGGGARPLPIVRGTDDQYKSDSFPNYHYVRWQLDGSTLKAVVFRVADGSAASPSWQTIDEFTVGP
jgi:hypothetical protein